MQYDHNNNSLFTGGSTKLKAMTPGALRRGFPLPVPCGTTRTKAWGIRPAFYDLLWRMRGWKRLFESFYGAIRSVPLELRDVGSSENKFLELPLKYIGIFRELWMEIATRDFGDIFS